ncbi:MAG: gfo/Idh/MocA family oxidoreductase [Planctomycetaceae bacterium]|nr:MAG: gfo/Idh/MocA family oxidoreductase [Planctomycetaceae bacterium]
MDTTKPIDRRSLLRGGAAVGAAMTFGPWDASADVAQPAAGTIKVGVIGCGSVSRPYLSHLARCPLVELVSVCDILPDRARQAADRHKIPHHYPHIDPMLAGASFDLFVNLTDMQEHERLNELALEAGRHVWSEKPIANSLDAGQRLLELARKKGVRLWGAPTVVQSPQFAFMAKTLGEGKLGRLAAAHASYGHLGPNWASFFYTEGGGSLPDLGVYSLTTLTGLLGPAQSVVAMTSVVTPTRQITGRGEITVTAEDNAMILLDHGNGVLSHVQSGFNYFTPHEHSSTQQDHHTISLTGTGGSMSLAGYDWAPHAVDLATREHHRFQRHADARSDYVWENGASLVAECLATGREPLFTPEHALHVVEIMTAANESQKTGQRIPIRSTFPWPVL